MIVISEYAMNEFHSSSGQAGFAASIFVIGALIASLFVGKWIARVGYKKMLCVGVIASIVMTLTYFGVNSVALLLVIRLLHVLIQPKLLQCCAFIGRGIDRPWIGSDTVQHAGYCCKSDSAASYGIGEFHLFYARKCRNGHRPSLSWIPDSFHRLQRNVYGCSNHCACMTNSVK